MGLTTFKDLVYAAVRRIPAGQTASYSDIAKLIGKPQTARAVGNALHHNPYEWGDKNIPRSLWVPCHRVTAKDGSPAHEFGFGGAEEQKFRLESEGVPILQTPTGYKVAPRGETDK